MKHFKFISGLVLGLILGISLFFFINCNSYPGASTASDNKLPDSFELVEKLNDYAPHVYRLRLDNKEYIVVSNRDAGVSIIEHK
jgi:hypothetical protein